MIEVLKGSELLPKKLAHIKELATTLQLAGGMTMTREQQMEMDNWQTRLAFRLNELVMESKLKEADIRIECFEGMINILKPQK